MSGQESQRIQAQYPKHLDEQPRSADILLVTMPFGPQVLQPSLGLSLLKASVKPLGISTKVLYLTLKLAERIGVRDYFEVANLEPTVIGFAGDWIFNGVLFDSIEHDVEGYVNDILRAPNDPSQRIRDTIKPVAEKLIQRILDVREMAPALIEDCLQDVLSYSPRIVGFTSTFQQHVGALALAGRIKQEAPNTVILFGGANCEGVMGVELLRQFEFVDAVVCGEGDVVFPQLVERLLNGGDWSGLQGVNTRDNSGFSPLTGARYSAAGMILDMDSLPYPDHGDFFAQLEAADLGDRSRLGPPRLLFETSRGCWWGEKAHCTFCGLNGATMAFRAKSEKRALEELLYFHEKYPECLISATDNILDMKYFKSFIPELAAHGVDLELFYEVKANLRKEHVKMMRDAGILDIQPGIESFIDDVLQLMRKGVKGAQNVQLLKWCKEFGVTPHWNMLWGFPGESPESYVEFAETMPLLFHLPPARGCGMIRLDRFSPNFNQADELGFVELAPYPAYSYVYPLEPAVVANLVGFFTYKYREPRDVHGYTQPLRELLEEWQEEYESSDLFSVDKGDQLLVWDFRNVAVQPLTVLKGPLRIAYIACDSICSVKKMQAVLARETGEPWTGEQVKELLTPVVARGLMMYDDKFFLSLAIPLGDYSPSVNTMKRLQSAIEGLGVGASGTVTINVDRHSMQREEVVPMAAA